MRLNKKERLELCHHFDRNQKNTFGTIFWMDSWEIVQKMLTSSDAKLDQPSTTGDGMVLFRDHILWKEKFH